jgi:serine/threonine-protein kinase HipA
MKLDIHLNGDWHPCGQVALIESAGTRSRRASVRLKYDADYAVSHLGAIDYRALTIRAPVDLGFLVLRHWPSFLIDLLPQGAARKRLERLAQASLDEWTLLERGAVNPVGNLRVRPAEPRPQVTHRGFDLAQMTARGDEFIDFASEVGATVAGATDTQGEAPKFWVIQDENGRWHPDSGNANIVAARYALLKFPVPEAGPRAQDILRHEAAYQRVAARLGLRVTNPSPEFIDGALLIPRFDRRCADGIEVRLGVESLYSVAGVLDSAESTLRHHDALIALSGCLTNFETEMTEYVRRDLLNIALGNRDNHGRNTAILKDVDGTMRLAPLFDFGPAYLDARAIARVMRWEGEQAGATDWNRVLELLALRSEEAAVAAFDWRRVASVMRSLAGDLESVPRFMHGCGVDGPIVQQRQPEIEALAQSLSRVVRP